MTQREAIIHLEEKIKYFTERAEVLEKILEGVKMSNSEDDFTYVKTTGIHLE